MCGVSLGGGEIEVGELVGVEGRVVVLGRGLFSDILGCGGEPPSLCLSPVGGEIECCSVFSLVGGEIGMCSVSPVGLSGEIGMCSVSPVGGEIGMFVVSLGRGEIGMRGRVLGRLVGAVGDGAEGWVACGEFALGVLAVVEEELVGLGCVQEVSVGGVFFWYVGAQ